MNRPGLVAIALGVVLLAIALTVVLLLRARPPAASAIPLVEQRR